MMESPEIFLETVRQWLMVNVRYVCVVLIIVIAYLLGVLRGFSKASGKTTSIQLRPLNPATLEILAGPSEQLPAIYEAFDE